MSTTTNTSRTDGPEEQGTGYPLVAEEWGEDPLAGIPQEVVDRVGALDRDTAGGCG